MSNVLAGLLALACVGCAAGPAAPSPVPAASPHVVLAGQSNALYLRPYLAAEAPTMLLVGQAEGGAPLAWWDEGADGWRQLRPLLTSDVRAFVWFQGEADSRLAYPTAPSPEAFAVAADAFFRRVRITVGNPALPIYICQLKTRIVSDPDSLDLFWPVNGVLQQWVTADGHATWVRTDDLEWEGGYHMTAVGYTALAKRLAALVR